MAGFVAGWSGWLERPAARVELASTGALLLLCLVGFVEFLGFVEARPGVVLADPVLARLAPRDLSLPIFAVIYPTLFAGLVALARQPGRLLFSLQCYCGLLLVRAAAMTLLPLDPPPAMIPLEDPLVAGASAAVTRDLFFSGHTSTLFLLFLLLPAGRQRALALAGTGAVAAGLLVQHVHYAVDVFAAPFFALGAVRGVAALRRGLGLAQNLGARESATKPTGSSMI